jgi:hypothetical protein
MTLLLFCVEHKRKSLSDYSIGRLSLSTFQGLKVRQRVGVGGITFAPSKV